MYWIPAGTKIDVYFKDKKPIQLDTEITLYFSEIHHTGWNGLVYYFHNGNREIAVNRNFVKSSDIKTS